MKLPKHYRSKYNYEPLIFKFFTFNTIDFINYFFFNKSVINKKNYLKKITISFVENLYLYLSSCSGENNTKENALTIEELYAQYIELINISLAHNKESIEGITIDYIKYLALDYIDHCYLSEGDTFIYLNNNNHYLALKDLITDILDFSHIDDYYTFNEFKNLMQQYETCYLNITEKEIYECSTKVPKRLKRRKKIEI